MIHYTLTTSSEYAFTHAAIVARFLEDEDVPDSEMAQVLATILGELLFQLRDDAVHEPNYEMWITTVRGAEPWDLVLR